MFSIAAQSFKYWTLPKISQMLCSYTQNSINFSGRSAVTLIFITFYSLDVMADKTEFAVRNADLLVNGSPQFSTAYCKIIQGACLHGKEQDPFIM